MRTLAELRREMDAIDDGLVVTLNRRFALVREMQALKRSAGLPAKDEAREREIVARALAACDPAERDTVFGIYERIFNGGRGTIETIARGVCVRDGKVLLCRAKGGATTYLPGGHIEFGETGREALVREVKEETGCDSRAGEFLGVVENSFLQHGKPHSEINLVYALDVVGDSVESAEEWIGFEWCDVGAIGTVRLLPDEMARFLKTGGV